MKKAMILAMVFIFTGLLLASLASAKIVYVKNKNGTYTGLNVD